MPVSHCTGMDIAKRVDSACIGTQHPTRCNGTLLALAKQQATTIPCSNLSSASSFDQPIVAVVQWWWWWWRWRRWWQQQQLYSSFNHLGCWCVVGNRPKTTATSTIGRFIFFHGPKKFSSCVCRFKCQIDAMANVAGIEYCAVAKHKMFAVRRR